MTWLILGCAVLIFIFSFVIFYGAPFLPTLRVGTTDALDLLNLKPGQILLELGCGDGRVLRAAAKRGIKATGYELNPLLAIYAKLGTLKYRRLVTVRFGNYWRTKWPDTDGIYVFLLDRYMAKLDKKITQDFDHKVKVVSYAFKIPGRTPLKELNGMFLYEYKLK